MKNIIMTACTAVALLSFAACSGSGAPSTGNVSGNIDVGTGSGDASTDTQEAFSSAFTISQQALSTALASGGSGGAAALVKPRANFVAIDLTDQACSASGTYSITGDYDTSTAGQYSYDFTLDYNECDGVNGTLNYVGNYTYSSTQFDYTSTLTGDFGGYGCVLSFDDFSYSFSYSTATSAYTGTYNGSYSSDCDGNLVECTYDNVDLYDTSAFADSCTLNGEALSTDSSSESLTFEGDIEAFFLANHGEFTMVAATRDGNTGATFTDGNNYVVTVFPAGRIVVETNDGDIEMTFDEAYYFETNASETTFIWKAADDSNILYQVDGGVKQFVISRPNGTSDYWDLNETI